MSLDSNVLAQLLVMQTALDVLPDVAAMMSFVATSLGIVPGVGGCRVEREQEETEEAEALTLPLRTCNSRDFGSIHLALDDAAAFAPYEPFVRNLAGALASLLESREQLRRLEEASERLERYRLLAENTRDLFLVVAEDGAIVDANSACAEAYHWTREELLTRTLWDLEARPVQDRSLSGRVSAGVIESDHCRSDGSVFPVELGFAKLEQHKGQLFAVIGRDLSSRAALAGARRLEAIGRLAAAVAHEVNTPVQFIGDNMAFVARMLAPVLVVLNAAQVVAASETSNRAEVDALREALEKADTEFLVEELPRALAESREGLGRVAQIVQALRRFARPSGASPRPVDIAAAVEDALTVAGADCRRVASLSVDVPEDLPQPYLVPGELQQVLLHLLLNTARVLDDQPGEAKTIAVQARAYGTCVEITVCDNVGTPPASDEEQIVAAKVGGRGIGQGMALAHSIIVRAGGAMRIDTAPGAGNTVVVRLPLRDDTGSSEVGSSSGLVGAPE